MLECVIIVVMNTLTTFAHTMNTMDSTMDMSDPAVFIDHCLPVIIAAGVVIVILFGIIVYLLFTWQPKPKSKKRK